MSLFHTIHMQASMDGDAFIIGSVYTPVQFPALEKVEVLYLMFFLSFAVATKSTLKTRMKLLIMGFLCLISLILVEFLIAVAIVTMGISSKAVYVEANVIILNIVASAFMQKALFSNMMLPLPTKVTPVIRTSNIIHFVYLAATLSVAGLVGYTFLEYFQLSENRLFIAFMAISLGEILALKSYLANFIYEVKTPHWAKVIRSRPGVRYDNMSVSFLIPAFNEEKFIKRCIESFDKIASKYSGWTEILIINDGSTDNTRKIASEAILNLKYANGKVYNIPHSGLVYALQYGLQKARGDIIFRADGDSVTHEDALNYLIYHFSDPRVATLSGAILSLEEKVWWQKIQTLAYCSRIMYKRQVELFDSILTQGGTFTVFRRDALIKAGGWIHDIMGEDTEMTVRLGRYGYRHEFDPRAIQFGNVPIKWKDIVTQRLKWAMAYYQTYSANANVLKELKPLSVQFAIRMLL
ncbi:MAG: glycosyltransferase, partial [Thaumarchaeota archaeon]|nr:glycosyltransferase [Nitrososphaerota archaeon]